MSKGSLSLANKLTIFRITLIPVFMAFLLSTNVLRAVGISLNWGIIMAGIVFVVAAVTDTIDGYLARSRGEVTAVGQILDPLADKLLVSAALISLVGLGQLSAWVAMVIIGREFAVMGLRTAAAVKHVVIPASPLGKAKTVSQVIAILGIILLPSTQLAAEAVKWVLMAVAVILTLMSGVAYFSRSRDILFDTEEG